MWFLIPICILSIIYLILSMWQKNELFTFSGIIRKALKKRKETEEYIALDTSLIDVLIEFILIVGIWSFNYINNSERIVRAIIISLISIAFLLPIWSLLLYLLLDTNILELIGFFLLAGLLLFPLYQLQHDRLCECIAYVMFNASVVLITLNGIPITQKERIDYVKINGESDEKLAEVTKKTVTALAGLLLQMIGTMIVFIHFIMEYYVKDIMTVCIIFILTYSVVKITRIAAHYYVSKRP